jgi:hypothetical protein
MRVIDQNHAADARLFTAASNALRPYLACAGLSATGILVALTSAWSFAALLATVIVSIGVEPDRQHTDERARQPDHGS